MKKGIILSAFLGFLIATTSGQEYRVLTDQQELKNINSTNGIDKPVTVRIVYDNYTVTDAVKADWGYAIVITGLEKGVMFDAGAKADIFESNFRKMGMEARDIDYLVLSHEHGDHTEGIPGFMNLRKGIPVLLPQSFSTGFKRKMTEFGMEPVMIDKPATICANLYTSGDFAGPIPEQALVLNTKQGLVVMTGCSHPGIVEMLTSIKNAFNKNIYMVFGGFHLLQKTEKETESIIKEMKSLGVVKCGATHCTGEMQTKMFREAFGENFFLLGAGNAIEIN